MMGFMLKEIDVEAVIRDRAAGLTQNYIAAKHGVSESTINRILRGCSPHPVKVNLAECPEIEAILTAVFRKVMGHCPIADGVRE